MSSISTTYTARVARIALCGGLLCGTVAAQETDAPAPEAEPVPAVHELISERQALQDFLTPLLDLDTAGFIAGPESRIAELREQLQPISQVVAGNDLDTLSLDALFDLETDVRAEIDGLAALAGTLSARASSRDEQLDELAERQARWEDLDSAARQRNAPPEVLSIATQASALLERTQSALQDDRDAALRLLSGILDLQLDAAAFNREIRSRRQTLETASQRASGLPIWSPQLAVTDQQISTVSSNFGGFLRSIRQHLTENGFAVLGWFFAAAFLTRWLLTAGRAKVSEFVSNAGPDERATAVFERPGPAALLVGLIGVLWFAPPAPVTFGYIITALLPWPAAWLATNVFAKPLRLSAYVLAAALTLMALRPLNEGLPLAGRGLNLLLTLAVAVAFLIDLRRGNWSRALPELDAGRLRIGVLFVCALLAAVLAADVLGFVGAANTLRSLTLGGLGYGMIFVVLSYVLGGLALAALQSRGLAKLSTVRHAPWAIVRIIRKLITWIALISWIVLTLDFSGLASRVGDALIALLRANASIGAVSVPVAALIAGAVVLWLTWLINRFIRFVMDNRALDYQSAASGLAFAISKVLRYAIIVTGVLLALSAMGFDITRVTVLAGALGVGIGLGLQNIANNFVSGIIMLFERPVQVNDIAKVDETIGTIKEIGIRSTVLQTFDGAEVIVPNADFMAKTVLNWTKSNRRRRAEIDVGVEYGTDPKKVLEILDAAAHSHEDVLEDPPPLAAFTGFGDSSLNFRLYLWLSDLANFLKAPSVIRQDILSRLNAAGIQIPFPQRDIRVTMSADGPAASTASAGPVATAAPPVVPDSS